MGHIVVVDVWIVFGTVTTLLLSLIALGFKAQMTDIPTIGHKGPILSYISAMRYMVDAPSMLQEGYEKCKGGLFKVPRIGGWWVIVTSPKFIEELAMATDKELSQSEAVIELLSSKWTLGDIHDDAYYIPILKNELTRALPLLASSMRDEIVCSVKANICLGAEEWTPIPALHTFTRILCQIVNGVLVGFPLCRNPDWIDLNIQFTLDVMKTSAIINCFPQLLQPLVGRLFSKLDQSVEQSEKYLRPLVEEYEVNLRDFGEKKNNLLSWMMDSPNTRTLRELSLRMLTVNMAAIHSSAMTFTHALFHLATNPQYIECLRHEIDHIVADEGWTKTSLDKMWELDSFLKESTRLDGILALTMDRKVMKPFHFSNGTGILAGTLISVASGAIHIDEKIYDDPLKFDPFRFARLRQQGGSEGLQYQLSSTSLEYLGFGHRRHACPGRFFAANEIKALLAHIITTYDVKFEAEGKRPPNTWFTRSCMPCAKAQVLFRERKR